MGGRGSCDRRRMDSIEGPPPAASRTVPRFPAPPPVPLPPLFDRQRQQASRCSRPAPTLLDRVGPADLRRESARVPFRSYKHDEALEAQAVADLPCYCISLPHPSFPQPTSATDAAAAAATSSPPTSAASASSSSPSSLTGSCSAVPYLMHDTMPSFHHRIVAPGIVALNQLMRARNPREYGKAVKQQLLDSMLQLPVEMIDMVLDYSPVSLHTDCSSFAPFLFQGTAFSDRGQLGLDLLERFVVRDSFTAPHAMLLLAGWRVRQLHWWREGSQTLMDLAHAPALLAPEIVVAGSFTSNITGRPDRHQDETIFTLEVDEWITSVQCFHRSGMAFRTNLGRECRVTMHEDLAGGIARSPSPGLGPSSRPPTPTSNTPEAPVWTVHAPTGCGLVGMQKHPTSQLRVRLSYLVCVFAPMPVTEDDASSSPPVQLEDVAV